MRALVLFPLLLLAAPAMAADIACEGPFAADSSEARLIEAFGKDNVVTGDVPGPEGSTVLATTIFPNDPARTIEFGWWDEEKHERVAYFTVPPDDTAPGGLRKGLTVKEVEALNGGPFQLYGFFWDYGGAAIFDGGKLDLLADYPRMAHADLLERAAARKGRCPRRYHHRRLPRFQRGGRLTAPPLAA